MKEQLVLYLQNIDIEVLLNGWSGTSSKVNSHVSLYWRLIEKQGLFGSKFDKIELYITYDGEVSSSWEYVDFHDFCREFEKHYLGVANNG